MFHANSLCRIGEVETQQNTLLLKEKEKKRNDKIFYVNFYSLGNGFKCRRRGTRYKKQEKCPAEKFVRSN